MAREVIHTAEAPAAIGPYSQAIRIEAAGKLVYTSGQIPLDPATGQIVGGDDVTAQTEQVMKNLEAVLEAAGSGFDRVVKTAIFLVDMGDFAKVNEVYGRYFPKDPPARSCVAVRTLPKNVRVEIEVIALA